MSVNGQDAAAQANKFGEDDSLSANRSEDDGHGGGDAPTHISGLTEPTGRVNFHGSDRDVSMNNDPLNAWPISGTPREHNKRDLAAERQRATLEAEQQLASEQARAAARQQVEQQPQLLLPLDRA